MSATYRIHALPLHLANQIAAGEVIERPASVVKELVENSLDAGATLIDVDIEGAGNQLIRVRDNGVGIHCDDLALALSRHATSKLHSSEQLSAISSLGFRGEALPSISSISQLTLTSRQQESDYAWQLKGEQGELSPASHPVGTTIEVRDLFFNLPARRHFLRSNKTEQNHILTTLQRLALSQFEIGFNCILSDKLKLILPIASNPQQQRQRLAKICGKAFIDNSLYLQQDYGDIELHGWLAKAEAHRAQTDVQYFFINGRVIRDRVINHAIRQAFADSIPAGRYPAYVLYLSLPLDKLDINVHPTKHEVRFRDARLIHGLITSALQEALSQTEPEQLEITAAKDNPRIPESDHIAEQARQYQSSIPAPATSPLKMDSHFGQLLTLLEQRYAICQSPADGLVLIDLQRAEHQLCGQQLLDALADNDLRTRPILVPIKLVLSAELLAVAKQNTAALEQYGVSLSFVDNSVTIKTIPSLLTQANIKALVTALITALSQQQPLTPVLINYIPLKIISSTEHAQQIIKQLERPTRSNDWFQLLDQQTLNSLFSSTS